MSGGHFDYKNYLLNEFISVLEEDILEAKKPKPDKVLFHSISICRKINGNCWSYLSIPNYIINTESAINWLKQGCKELTKMEGNLWSDGINIYEIRESDYYDYPDRQYRLELKQDTIKILEETVVELRALSDKLHLIDYVMSGDSSEDDLIEKYGNK